MKTIPVWEGVLKPCPCCGAPADFVDSSVTGEVTITCSKHGCKMVVGRDFNDASKIWNEPRFSQAKP